MTGPILVLSTVHRADDPRVREKTVRTLAGLGEVRYATRPPAPAGRDDHHWVALPGGRLRRNWAALRLCLDGGAELVSLHDPELIPAGVLASRLRGTPVVFDLHENLAAQLLTKEWLPGWSRRPLARLAGGLLRLAERHLTVTLAEAGYQQLFSRPHPVFENYPLGETLPPLAPDGGYLVYLGDVSEARGARLAVQAVAGMARPLPLRMVGRSWEPFAARLREEAGWTGVSLELTGLLGHREALEQAAGARVALSPLLDLPNYRHSLPTKVVEYLAVGVPVVASDFPGTAQVVGGMPGVHLVAAGQPQAWSEALDRVCGDPGEREKAQQNAASIRDRFAWPTQAVQQVYRRAAAGGRTANPGLQST
ncbi:MAG: glycosyltransferase family 4 protein [Acidimicrobiia bacterium]